VLVFIHGGYWRAMDKKDHSFIAPAFNDRGVCVVQPNYALCPGTPEQPVTVPGIVLQMVRALAWTWRHIAAHGGDPARITVAGHSAGGHMAAALLACDWKAVAPDLPEHLVRNALSISGLYDLAPLQRTPFLEQVLRLSDEDVRRASPAYWPAPKRGLLYAVAGGNESEEFIRHNAMIREAWGSRAVPVCELLPGLDHCGVVPDERGRLKVNPATFQTQIPHIYAAGDVIGFPSLASTSMEQGRIAALHAFGATMPPAPEFFPYGIYAVPEISTVGLTEQQVRAQNIPYECGVARFRETSRGHIMGLQSGMMKMIVSLETRRLLGVHIVGEGATELIHIGQAVLNLGATLDYFVENTFNYPTLAEAYKIAALDAWNRMPRVTPAAPVVDEVETAPVRRKAAAPGKA